MKTYPIGGVNDIITFYTVWRQMIGSSKKDADLVSYVIVRHII